MKKFIALFVMFSPYALFAIVFTIFGAIWPKDSWAILAAALVLSLPFVASFVTSRYQNCRTMRSFIAQIGAFFSFLIFFSLVFSLAFTRVEFLSEFDVIYFSKIFIGMMLATASAWLLDNCDNARILLLTNESKE